jgi:hypothetical protein
MGVLRCEADGGKGAEGGASGARRRGARSLRAGDAVPASDVDLIVVLCASPLPFLDRIPFYTPAVPPLAVDVLPYTEAELLRMFGAGHPLLARALAEGEWVVGPPPSLGAGT